MLGKLLGPKRESTPQINEDLTSRIIIDLRIEGPKTRWEIQHRYGQIYGEDAVHAAIDRAIEIGEIFEQVGALFFNFINNY